ncbi:MAG: hypothetical protein HY527_05585 [Betaproteobacteria bacterium]|nr:hypothetical protein [Betaproteobacteria bacterium]
MTVIVALGNLPATDKKFAERALSERENATEKAAAFLSEEKASGLRRESGRATEEIPEAKQLALGNLSVMERQAL